MVPKTSAWWDGDTKATNCEACGAAPDRSSPEPATASRPADRPRGVAGGSAQREYERRKANRERGIRSRHPRVGGLILALTDDPHTTTNWAKGAAGEREIGAQLEALAEAGLVAIHDRLRPDTKANIDHVAVAPSGVWVIDPKCYQGEVTRRDAGGWFSTDVRLYVGRRDCTKLVTAMSKQVDAVREALGSDWAAVPVRPMLCFVDAEWRWFAKPIELQGVLVTWPKAMRELLVRPGPYAPATVQLIVSKLDERLRPAS